MSVNIGVGTAEYDGILMYVVHRGMDQTANQVFSAAGQVWFDENSHPAASLYGVAETDIKAEPDAEIIDQVNFKKYPTLLFCRVKDGQIVAVLSRLEGAASYKEIQARFLKHLKAEPTTKPGEGGGEDDFWNADGSGGLGLGIGDLFKGGCPSWLPNWICDFPVWLFALLIILLVLVTIKILK